jgi:hypothetical protein
MTIKGNKGAQEMKLLGELLSSLILKNPDLIS